MTVVGEPAPPSDAVGTPRRIHPVRRRLALLAWASLLPLGGLWRTMSREHRRRPRASRVHVLPEPLPEGLTVDGPVAVWREGGSVTAVSRRCSHLGCTVRDAGDGSLVCPCHGSRFDGRGRVQRGPARSDLRPLRVSVQTKSEGFRIDLPS